MNSESILRNFWQRCLEPGRTGKQNTEWNTEMQALYAHGAGMEETLHYLYRQKPAFEEFLVWLSLKNQGDTDEPDMEEDFLRSGQLDFFNENGYLLIPSVFSAEDCARSRQAIWDFLEMSPGERQAWYKTHPGKKGMMLTLTQHPALNKNRNSKKIKRACEQLYGTKNIYRTVDKVSFNPPETEHCRFAGDGLHWDVSLHPPVPFSLQGLIYLSDCEAHEGAFNCVPGFHKKINEWLASLPVGSNPRGLVARSFKPVAVPGKAGDVILWHQALPHCATPNKGALPRMVQYLTYKLIDSKNDRPWV